nr:MAG TPA: hypothetical protein [Caudoviricetes sp.]
MSARHLLLCTLIIAKIMIFSNKESEKNEIT